MDTTILTDIDRHISDIRSIGAWIDKVYYHPDFSTLTNRPVLSMLKTATIYLSENLEILRAQFIARAE